MKTEAQATKVIATIRQLEPARLPLSGGDPVDELRVIQDCVTVLRLASRGLTDDVPEDRDALCMFAASIEGRLSEVRAVIDAQYRRVPQSEG